MLGIAGEPQPRALDGAARHGLLDKGARHERGLVEQHAREGDPLDERGAPLVPPAEKVEAVAPVLEGNLKHAAGKPLLHRKAELPQAGKQRGHDVAAQGGHRLAAEREALPVKACHRPEEEPERKAERLAAAHRPVADDRVAGLMGASRPPPGERGHLLLGKPGEITHLPRPPRAGRRRGPASTGRAPRAGSPPRSARRRRAPRAAKGP